jgi:D-threo-aldose 1-dehydrogenase
MSAAATTCRWPRAALQFPPGHRGVVSVIPGSVASEEVRQNLAWLRQPIPEALWAELKAERLIRAEAPTPRLNGPA